jgi:predicted TIM-barrel fold metal-dependent hydrolase
MLMRVFALLLLAAPAVLSAQTVTFEEYDPPSTLVVPQHPVTRARFPVIDVHSHHFEAPTMTAAQAAQIVAEMDALNLRTLVNLSGRSGAELRAAVQNMDKRHPQRFITFANINFEGIDDPGYGARAAAQLEQDVRSGAQGLKIFKNLGMEVRDRSGRRVPTDDARLDPVWRKAAELRIPVLIHTGDPAPFWQPHDKNNERWLELKEVPNRIRPPEKYPPFDSIMAEQHRLFARHPNTIFINAHLGWYGHDLGKLGELLDRYPNMYTEIGAVLAELGRQPRNARAFLTKYQDRVLFGKDLYRPEEYHTYFRVLETADEYFDYYRRRHAFWKMYGLDLPADVLKKLYYKNALRIIPNIDASGFPD